MNNETNDDSVTELHDRHIREFIKQMGDLFNEFGNLIAYSKPPATNDDHPFVRSIGRETGHDKIIGFRNKLGTTPNPNHKELAALIKKRTNAFEYELRNLPSIKEKVIALALQEFKEDLMATVYSGVQ